MAQEAARGVSRRGLFGLAVGCLVAAYSRPAKADLFGGDITVLLAQLEQQLTLVSNAISTVQRVTETAQRAYTMVTQGKQMLAMATGQGGLSGFLSGLKGIVDTGRMATGNLQRVNIRGGQWKDHIATDGLTFREGMALTGEAMDMDRRFLGNVADMSKSWAQVMNSFDGLQSAADAVHEASSVTGVVGQVQILGREMYQLTGITAQMTMGMGMMGNMQANELARQAAIREANRALVLKFYGDYGHAEEAAPTDVTISGTYQ